MLTTRDIKLIPCGLYRENAYLVCPEGRDDCALIDPGDDLALLRHMLDACGRRLAAILLTHGHFDHLLAAGPLAEQTGAEIYLHADDEALLKDPERMAYDPEAAVLPPPEALSTKRFGRDIEVCGETFTVLETPGHTMGSVCLHAPESRVLFSGDTLFQAGYGRTDLYGGDEGQMALSLLMLLTTLPEETVVFPGHGSPTTIGAERKRYRL